MTTPILIILIGPAGAGKTTYAARLAARTPNLVVHSTDDIRQETAGDFKDQSHNQRVFEVFHDRIRNSLADPHIAFVVADATNLHPASRATLRGLNPNKTTAYVLIDRPLPTKKAQGAWRNSVILSTGETLVENHHRRFQEQLPALLAGDYNPEVAVYDLRTID